MITPVNRGSSGIVKADGTLTLEVANISASEWSSVLASFQAAGNPQWTLNIGGRAVGFGAGAQVDIGSRLCAPNDKLQISIIGGLPGTEVAGQFHGGRSPDMQEAIQFGNLVQANTISVKTSNPRQKLFPDGVTPPANPLTPSFIVAPATAPNFTFTIPTGTVSLRIMATAIGLAFTYQMNITGVNTKVQYFGDLAVPGNNVLVGLPTLPLTIPVGTDWDRQVLINITGDAVQTVDFFISALFAPEAPGQAGDAQSVRVTSPAQTIITPFDWTASQAFDGPVAAPSITIAGFTGLRTVIAAYICDIVVSAAVGYVGTLSFNDGAGTFWRRAVGVQAIANAINNLDQSGLAITSAVGNGFTMSVNNAIVANQFMRLSFGGYYQK